MSWRVDRTASRAYPDARSRDVMLATIEFFERKGKRYYANVWYADFLDFAREKKKLAFCRWLRNFRRAAIGPPNEA